MVWHKFTVRVGRGGDKERSTVGRYSRTDQRGEVCRADVVKQSDALVL